MIHMTKEELDAILNKMLREITIINTNWVMWNGLRDELQEGSKYNKLLEYSPCFWTITLNNLLSKALLGTAKLYDEDRESLGLKKLINKCEQNQGLFPKSRTIKCTDAYTGNPDNFTISKNISADIVTLREKYESVRNYREQLMTLRDKHLAHMDKKYFLIDSDLYSKVALKKDSLEELIKTAGEIANCLLSNLSDTTVYVEYHNSDDYEILLHYIKEGKEAYLQKIKSKLNHKT